MTISSSLNAGVAGLNANAAKLATISDNISNSSTYGYKRAETDFHSVVVSNSGAGVYSAGGVRATNQRMVDESGTLVATSNSTDITVKGRGMLPVTDLSAIDNGGNLPFRGTTTGSFRPNDDGYLVNATGQVLMGWKSLPNGTIPAVPRDSSNALEPIQINANSVAANPTTRIQLGVNLPADATMPGALGQPETLPVEYYGNLGTAEALEFEFVPTVGTTAASNTWTMNVTDRTSGNALGSYQLVFDDTRTGKGTLLSVTHTSGPGSAYDPVTGNLTLSVPSGDLTIALKVPGDPDGLTQVSGPFQPTKISKDGSTVGNMTSVEIDEGGYLYANYDTGFSQLLYQVPVMDVPNFNGMKAFDNQTYGVSRDSGPFYLWNAGDGPVGETIGFAREESTTDVAKELTQLITTQRAYSSNAKVIQTVDEMLQETTNLKR